MLLTKKERLLKLSAQLLIWVHFITNIPHAVAHLGAGVSLPALGMLYVIVVITIAPLVALVWLPRSLHWGAGLLALAMAGSLFFGVANHFLLPGQDNVASVPGIWHATFEITAYLLMLLEATGTVLGIWIFAITRPSSASDMDSEKARA